MPAFDSRITLGNWITIATLLVSIGVAWGSLSTVKDSTVATGVKVDAMAVKQAEMHEKQAEMDIRLRNVEKQIDEYVTRSDASQERTRRYENRH